MGTPRNFDLMKATLERVAEDRDIDAMIPPSEIARKALDSLEKCPCVCPSGNSEWDSGDVYHEHVRCRLPLGHEGKHEPISGPYSKPDYKTLTGKLRR